MPKYYHIHRGTSPSTLEKKFIKNRPLFFLKKTLTGIILKKIYLKSMVDIEYMKYIYHPINIHYHLIQQQ